MNRMLSQRHHYSLLSSVAQNLQLESSLVVEAVVGFETIVVTLDFCSLSVKLLEIQAAKIVIVSMAMKLNSLNFVN